MTLFDRFSSKNTKDVDKGSLVACVNNRRLWEALAIDKIKTSELAGDRDSVVRKRR